MFVRGMASYSRCQQGRRVRLLGVCDHNDLIQVGLGRVVGL